MKSPSQEDIEEMMDTLYFLPLRKLDARFEVGFKILIHPVSFMFENDLTGMRIGFTEIVDNEQ